MSAASRARNASLGPRFSGQNQERRLRAPGASKGGLVGNPTRQTLVDVILRGSQAAPDSALRGRLTSRPSRSSKAYRWSIGTFLAIGSAGVVPTPLVTEGSASRSRFERAECHELWPGAPQP